MKSKLPVSFKIFIAVISITIVVFILANLFSYYQVDKKYAMFLGALMFIALAFTTVGIYTGFVHKTEDSRLKIYNRIGLTGNLFIFLLTIGLTLYAALTV